MQVHSSCLVTFCSGERTVANCFHAFIQYFAQNNSISVSVQPTMSLFEVLWNMSFATLGKKKLSLA